MYIVISTTTGKKSRKCRKKKNCKNRKETRSEEAATESVIDQSPATNKDGCNSTFYKNQLFFGCISIWWVACILFIIAIIVSCLIPKVSLLLLDH